MAKRRENTLYIVDGDSSGGSLRGLLPRAPILVWRDALYDGPVPGGLSLQELSRIRARHWNEMGNEPENAARTFARRDRALAQAHTFEEVILWFGQTMVCQLSLIQLLDWFSTHPVRKLTLIDEVYAGYLRPEQMPPYVERRRPVTRSMFRTARRAWRAFTASNPGVLYRFLDSDSAVLPQLRPILVRIAQEYPDASGLSRIERKLLAQFERPQRAFVGVANAMAGETFGDTYYFDALDRFIGATNQLLCFAEPPPENLRKSMRVLTGFGRKVLKGDTDAIAFNGIDRWVGGVHLEGYSPPRAASQPA